MDLSFTPEETAFRAEMRGEQLIRIRNMSAGGLMADCSRCPPVGADVRVEFNHQAIPAGWWWLVFTFLMGWLGFARVDGLTAPLVLVALAYGVGRPFIAHRRGAS